MRTILNLFGRSPFTPLKSHMEAVSCCVHLLKNLFNAVDDQNLELLEKVSNEICEKESLADMYKREIRKNLPKSIFLPIDRATLLDIVSMQDKIADCAEDIAVLLVLKKGKKPAFLDTNFTEFLNANIETFEAALKIIHEMHDLLESSFGGAEAEKVRTMVDDVTYKEHQVDVIERKLLSKLLNAENEITYTDFYVWMKTIETLARIASLSEHLAYRIRATLQ